MSSEKSRQILQKIITHIEHTLEYCQGETFESFMSNRMLQEACIFNILQIGELVQEAFGEKAELLYERLAQYMKILYGKGFITFCKV